MSKVHFHAVFLPNHKEFNVRVKFGGKTVAFEKMSIAKFLRFARQEDRPLVINGLTFAFDGYATSEVKQVRDYFKSVADAYVATKYKNN